MQVIGDPPSSVVVADPCQELDAASQQGQPDRHVQGAAPDMFSERLTRVLHDVDERFTDY